MIAGKPTKSSAAIASSIVVGDARAGAFKADAVHRVAEELAVFGHLDRFALGADHLDAEFFEHAHIGQRQRRVERGLPPHRRQQRVGPLLLDDLGDDFRRDRLDIGGVGQFRVGHDRGGVRVDQNDPVALVLQRLAGLRAGVIELASLTDDDRPGADDQDAVYVGAFGHGLAARLLDQIYKALKQVMRVLRAGRGFGVILHREDGLAFQADAAIRAVEERHMGFFEIARANCRASTVKPWFIDTISTLPVVKSLTGWLAPWWP